MVTSREIGMSEVWDAVHAERGALIRDLDSLTPEQWQTPSLCPDWDVHDVLAHLVDDAKTTRIGFVRELIAARFDFDRSNARGVQRERADDPRLTLDEFRTVYRRTTSAPAPMATRLVEIIVHGEDIRRPLGISHEYPVFHVAAALEYQVNTSVKFGGGKEKVQGLRLVATDGNVDIGTGADVRGSTLALLLAVSGRPVRADELTGPGAPSLIG
jgi:uncharacterized protein (TIGR03083 family)